MSRQSSTFHKEKRILSVFPYSAIVAVLLVLTILSYFPRRVSHRVLESAVCRVVIEAVMRQKKTVLAP